MALAKPTRKEEREREKGNNQKSQRKWNFIYLAQHFDFPSWYNCLGHYIVVTTKDWHIYWIKYDKFIFAREKKNLINFMVKNQQNTNDYQINMYAYAEGWEKLYCFWNAINLI